MTLRVPSNSMILGFYTRWIPNLCSEEARVFLHITANSLTQNNTGKCIYFTGRKAVWRNRKSAQKSRIVGLTERQNCNFRLKLEGREIETHPCLEHWVKPAGKFSNKLPRMRGGGVGDCSFWFHPTAAAGRSSACCPINSVSFSVPLAMGGEAFRSMASCPLRLLFLYFCLLVVNQTLTRRRKETGHVKSNQALLAVNGILLTQN